MDSEQRKHALALIQQALPDLDWTLQAAKVKRLSRDFHWFSPVLKQRLEGKQADAVVRPRNEEELILLVKACVSTPAAADFAGRRDRQLWSDGAPGGRDVGRYDRAQSDMRTG
ncbi:Uncharacterised protein [Raoultella terrigena]|uniref:Uncharacterized protein n=1 Tax=Raoultella terrigena TaxID=577 RepID=A0A4U9CY75_RAOTE|nr:Uncharacterised protein [Raoultella terrigena]